MNIARPVRQWLDATFEVDSSPQRFVPMEGLRGFAVLLVFFVHYVTLVEPWVPTGTAAFHVATAFRNLGQSGVDLFFVLSGFLIYRTIIRRPRPLLPFLRRRVQRIYPTFLCVFAIYLALAFAIPSENKIPVGFWNAVGYLLANLSLLPLLGPIKPLIVVTWSLSYEFFYYLAMPLLISVLALRRWRTAQRVTLWILIAAATFVYSWHFGGHVRLVMFVSGVLLHETLHRTSVTNADTLGFSGLLGGVVLAVTVSELRLNPLLSYISLFVAFYALCYGSLAAPGLCARLFSWPPLRWLGNMSYSYYLIHGLALKVFFSILSIVVKPQGNQGTVLWAILPLAFSATLVVATALFILVEKRYSLASAPSSAYSVSESRIVPDINDLIAVGDTAANSTV